MARARVLIADDEEGIRESLNLILNKEYDLDFAVNGEETLAKGKSGKHDLIILDIKMPKLDGVEVLRELRAAKVQTPVIMLTAYSSIEIARETIKYGAVDYLLKPFERADMLKSVADALKPA